MVLHCMLGVRGGKVADEKAAAISLLVQPADVKVPYRQ